MGLPSSSLPFFSRVLQAFDRDKPASLETSVMTYGVQRIGFTREEAVGALNIQEASGDTGVFDHWGFFRLLGFDHVHAMDICDELGPTHIHDLNTPVPEDLHGSYDMVFDGGTSEHVFNAPMVLQSTVHMVSDGGWAVHMLPMNNQVDHGFYQFSPTLFFDFYGANGFTGRGLFLYGPDNTLRRFCQRDIVCPHMAKGNNTIFFAARKTAYQGTICIPTQFCYAPHTKGLSKAVGSRPLFIWGTGGGFSNVYEQWLGEQGSHMDMRGFIDSNESQQGKTVCGHTVHGPQVLKSHPDAAVIVATTYWQQICATVRELFHPQEPPVRLLW